MCLALVGCGEPPSAEERFSGCEGDTAAHRNFDAFWRFFDEEYALFDLRLPDGSWYALGEEGCAAIEAKPDMPEDELFALMIGMLEHLDDGHSNVEAPKLGLDDDGWVSEYPHYDALYELEDNVEARYLDAPAAARAAWDELSWGTIGDIGYLSITSMEALDPDADDKPEDEEVLDRRAAESAMAKVMDDLGDARGMIVDVRANEGGWDTVSLAVAAWFAGPRTVAWSEQRRNGPEHFDFGPWEDTWVDAAREGAFEGPVVVLTSGGTFSAAEVFVLAMRVRDRVTILGERTSGHFSDMLDRRLPNGWLVDLSNERYRAADGEIYEVVGAPVDIEIPLDVAALATGRDTMLEEALRELGH